MILGAVLAGGQSSRFGSDKALAQLAGETLLTRAVDLLSGWCEKVIVVGREQAPAPTRPDWPRPGMGPLGGIAAALHGARDLGFDLVLTCGVDSLDLPRALPDLLAPAPAYLADQPVVGLWPISAIKSIEEILRGTGRHSVRAFAEAIGARAARAKSPSININTPEDLAQAEKYHGL
ncbi:MAG: molybdenum cofactor guanylyltransferase [Novosphingobium sp.]|uniref:molybdenum cofactor guanylyltransferase n=1 Tax=Novosphingobium sp. TaxID=1874826 RepID=UPI0032BBFBA7